MYREKRNKNISINKRFAKESVTIILSAT